MLATDGHRIIVAEVEGKVVGVLHMFERPALEKPCEVMVQALVVDSEARSSGVGEALMREAEAWAQSRKLPSVSLYSRDRPQARARLLRAHRLSHKGHVRAHGARPISPSPLPERR